MAFHSKYPNQQVEEILAELITVLEKHQAPLDLSLITLGNTVSNLLINSVGSPQRLVLARAFSQALLDSIEQVEKASKH
ncbi:hypothetical protein CEP48_01650 [Mergibacter septicus]|uniref:UPF0352 protein CEP48_01650 n=1 Tax=Mergibacter septicus TaxID=221402 RepID=A0A8E3S6C4_9PAST|nr:DUF1414 domain-containing protein [Mergibacter septicus]AWX14953.1 hypothetical protein CEP47_01650 [Mergibacter septicus]QDJ12393.1 hypothetical protein CEP45_00330 [Mergibacter septicus]QDJ14205.1 hypothetical protein CEP48_01650 [Mergibacter septicus]UTU48348.1 DUF1414 domain-containing protein [Mergibacter septicus]WMR96025.1 DUF1414 domain-containing protein [Mergibacter septicus]